MTALTDIRTRLLNQYLDPNNLVLNTDSLDEAIRSAMEEIARVHDTTLTLEGLDGALVTTLTTEDIAVLMTGAAANCMDYLLLGPLGHFTAIYGSKSDVIHWSFNYRLRFRDELEDLRLGGLQYTDDPPITRWPWVEDNVWGDGA